jgi:hypothetical protein
VSGWNLGHPYGQVEISGDGRTIVGNALSYVVGPDGRLYPSSSAYEVRLPPACSDGLDNDGDGRVDHPDDNGCAGRNDGSEDRPRRRGR